MSRLAEIARKQGTDPRALRDFARLCVQDPVHFGTQVLGSRYWSRQRDILYSVRDNRVTCVQACHNSGKSYVAADAFLWRLLIPPPSCIALSTAPSDRQVRDVLWGEIRKRHAESKIPLDGKVDLLRLTVDDTKKHFGLGFAAPDYDSQKVAGYHADTITVLVDEAAGVQPAVFDGLSGILGGGSARLLCIANPIEPNCRFKTMCEDSRNHRIIISAYDSPNFNIPGHELRERNFVCDRTDPEHWTQVIAHLWVEELREYRYPNKHLVTPEFVDLAATSKMYGVTSPYYVSRVLGQFPGQSEYGLFSLSEFEDAFELDLTQRPGLDQMPVRLGIDIARKGKNRTVVVGFQGDERVGVARTLAKWGKAGHTETCNRIEDIVQGLQRRGVYPSSVAIDCDGIGAAYYDELERRGLPMLWYSGAKRGEGVREGFYNTRADAYSQLQERLELRMLDLERDPLLVEQAITIEKKFRDNSSEIQIVGKEEMDRAGIDSPDELDALVIACYEGLSGRGDLGVTV